MTHPTGTVTFLFTDIEGSTKLAADHKDSGSFSTDKSSKSAYIKSSTP